MKTSTAFLGAIFLLVAPPVLSAQGLRVSSVIPTQTLLKPAAGLLQPVKHAHVAATATAAPAPSCNMLVARVHSAASVSDTGGVAQPADQSVPILTARSACVNRLSRQAPDSVLLKKQ